MPFFPILFSDENLSYYFQTNFALMHNYRYSITELEDMLPWERRVYIALLEKHLDEEKSKHNQFGT
jgi:hypothetical protein